LIKRLEGQVVADELNIKNIEEYLKVRIVYDELTDNETKRKLLVLSNKNKKIVPTKYENIQKIKQYVQ
jgi:hypothetical protein